MIWQQYFILEKKVFTAREVPNLYRTWDEYEVVTLFKADSEFCLVAEMDEEIVGFALGTTVTKTHLHGSMVIWYGWNRSQCSGHGLASTFHRFRDIMVEDGVRMLLVDSEADNLLALYFFRRMGFGSPQENIYLALNLDPQLRQHREKKVNGRSGSPLPERNTMSKPPTGIILHACANSYVDSSTLQPVRKEEEILEYLLGMLNGGIAGSGAGSRRQPLQSCGLATGNRSFPGS